MSLNRSLRYVCAQRRHHAIDAAVRRSLRDAVSVGAAVGRPLALQCVLSCSCFGFECTEKVLKDPGPQHRVLGTTSNGVKAVSW